MSDEKLYSESELTEMLERQNLGNRISSLERTFREHLLKEDANAEKLSAQISLINTTLTKIEKIFESHEDKMQICKSEMLSECHKRFVSRGQVAVVVMALAAVGSFVVWLNASGAVS